MNKQILKMQQSVEAKHCPFARQRSFSIFPVRCDCCKKFGGAELFFSMTHGMVFGEPWDQSVTYLHYCEASR